MTLLNPHVLRSPAGVRRAGRVGSVHAASHHVVMADSELTCEEITIGRPAEAALVLGRVTVDGLGGARLPVLTLAPAAADREGVDREMTPEQALEAAIADLSADAALAGGTAPAANVAEQLRDMGFRVAKDPHSNRWGPPIAGEGHDCFHCDRAENTDPFVIPGTPLELLSSEGDAGRYRHWGGSDMWICREHPNFMDGDRDEGGAVGRTMEVYEALEHLAARDGLAWALQLTHRAALDAAAPHGGHQGRQTSGPTS